MKVPVIELLSECYFNLAIAKVVQESTSSDEDSKYRVRPRHCGDMISCLKTLVMRSHSANVQTRYIVGGIIDWEDRSKSPDKHKAVENFTSKHECVKKCSVYRDLIEAFRCGKNNALLITLRGGPESVLEHMSLGGHGILSRNPDFKRLLKSQKILEAVKTRRGRLRSVLEKLSEHVMECLEETL